MFLCSFDPTGAGLPVREEEVMNTRKPIPPPPVRRPQLSGPHSVQAPPPTAASLQPQTTRSLQANRAAVPVRPVQWAHQPGQCQQLGLSSHNPPVAIQPHTINTPQPHKASAPTPSIPPLPNRRHPAQLQVAGLPYLPRLPASIPPVRMPQASHTVQRMKKHTKEERKNKPKKLGRANKHNV